MLTIKIVSNRIRSVAIDADVTCTLADVKSHLQPGENIFQVKDNTGTLICNSEEINDNVLLANNYKVFVETSAKGAGLLQELQTPATGLVRGQSVEAILQNVKSKIDKQIQDLEKELEEKLQTLSELTSEENLNMLSEELEALKVEQASRFVVYKNMKMEEYVEKMRQTFSTVLDIQNYGSSYLIEYMKLKNMEVPNFHLNNRYERTNSPFSLDMLSEMSVENMSPAINSTRERIKSIENKIEDLRSDLLNLEDGVEELFQS